MRRLAWHYQYRSQPWLLDRNMRFQEPEEHTIDPSLPIYDLEHAFHSLSTSVPELTTQQPEEHASDPDPATDDLGPIPANVPSPEPL